MVAKEAIPCLPPDGTRTSSGNCPRVDRSVRLLIQARLGALDKHKPLSEGDDADRLAKQAKCLVSLICLIDNDRLVPRRVGSIDPRRSQKNHGPVERRGNYVR